MLKDIYKSLFSHRNGLIQPVNILHRNSIPAEVINAISSAYSILCNALWEHSQQGYRERYIQEDIEKILWWQFQNMPLGDFYERGHYKVVFRPTIESTGVEWYRKLDLLEFVIRVSINRADEILHDTVITGIFEEFIKLLNHEFDRLDFGYRVVNYRVVDITSEEETKCLEKAIEESKDNVRSHLIKATELYSIKPSPDVQNSIKESISAVEAVCREYTGQDTLGKAIKKLEDAGIILQARLKSSLEQMYTYTNQPETGIRHALMDTDGKYVPSKEEAYFMLISCSAFVNYIRQKAGKVKII